MLLKSFVCPLKYKCWSPTRKYPGVIFIFNNHRWCAHEWIESHIYFWIWYNIFKHLPMNINSVTPPMQLHINGSEIWMKINDSKCTHIKFTLNRENCSPIAFMVKNFKSIITLDILACIWTVALHGPIQFILKAAQL